MSKEKLLNLELDLPDQTEELTNTEYALGEIKTRFREIQKNKSIDEDIHEELFEEIMILLDYLGYLSQSAFKLRDYIEDEYFKKYKNAPALAKVLWQEHYALIHRPYNILKNRCFRLIDELDKEYYNVHKTYPPNYK